jgi:hypothetical protein
MGEGMGWDPIHLERSDRPVSNNQQGRDHTGPNPSVSASTMLRLRRTKVTWNALVGFPHSFDFMIFQASQCRVDCEVNFGFIMLLFATNLSRQSIGYFNDRYHLAMHQNRICAAAGRLANHYAQHVSSL